MSGSADADGTGVKPADAASWFPTGERYALPSDELLGLNGVGWRLEPKRAILLVHDMQEFWLGRMADARDLVQGVRRTLAAARLADVPVVYSVAERARHPAERGLALERWGPGIAAAAADAERIVGALEPEARDYVVVKPRYSAFFETDLDRILRRTGRDQLVVTGVFAQHGCLATSLDAFMRNVATFMVANATADYTRERHVAALAYVAEVCGSISTVALVEAAFGAEGGASAPR